MSEHDFLNMIMNSEFGKEQPKKQEVHDLPKTNDNKKYEHYNVEELSRRNSEAKSSFSKLNYTASTEESLSSTDDDIRSKTWTEALKTAAYYYENPTVDDRYKMMNNLDHNFGNLFQNTKTPDEIPDLRSNKHLLKWVCKKYNEFLDIKGSNNFLNCNVKLLRRTYGPDIKQIQKNLGGMDFYM